MRLAIVAAVCLSMVGMAVAAESQAAMVKTPTNIPAQGLGPALKALAKDRGLQLVFRSEIVGNARTQGASGNLTTPEALTELLKGTDLSYSYLDENTVTIVPSGPAARSGAADQSQTTSQIAATQGGGKNSSQDFRVAQVDQNSAGPQVVGDDRNSEKKKKEDALTEIVVTGTNIRGAANTTSPIIQFDRAAIDRSGYLTTQDFIQSIPQAFAGGSLGASPDGNLGGGSYAQSNNEHASAVNLRGLGEGSTLVLVNGHRIVPSAFGSLVDISQIPLSAIDHIDVLTDGASAVYGADAIAGVVNIILRDKYDGADTRASYAGASGGLRQQVYSQTLGDNWDTGSVVGTFEYNHEGTLPTSSRSFTSQVATPSNILNPTTRLSLVLDGHQSIGDRLNISSDALFNWTRTISVLSYDESGFGTSSSFATPNAQNLHLDLAYALAESWMLEVGGTHSRLITDVGYTDYFGIPTVPLGSTTDFNTTKLDQYDVTLNGRAFALPGGDLKLALGYSRRIESEAADTVDSSDLGPSSYYSRNLSAEYAELYIPVVGAANSTLLIDRLVISAAVRRDDYSDFGATTNPKFGVLWSPTDGLQVKANWSKAFQPPPLSDLVGTPPTVFGVAFDNPSGPGTGPIFILGGANPNLGPERATNFNVGFDYRPPSLQGFKFSLDYYNVNFRDRIIFPPYAMNALLHPNLYGSLIGTLSSDAAAAAFLAGLQAQGYAFIDRDGAGSTGVRYTFVNTNINASVVRQNGFDVAGEYAFDLGMEKFRTSANVALINKIDTQFTYAPGAATTNLVNTYSNPLRLRVRWDANWNHGPLDVTTAINYSNAYTNPYSVPTVPVGSWMTVDLSAAVQLARNDVASLWDGASIRVSAANVLDRSPPYAVGNALGGVQYDVGNANPLGRFVSVQLQKKW